jgi:hypothetical protein
MEVKPFGIQVMLVEPGDHRSGSEKYRPHAAAMTGESPYAAAYDSATKVIHRDETGGSAPDVLGRKVARALDRLSGLPGNTLEDIREADRLARLISDGKD